MQQPAENAADSGAAGGDMYGSHGANYFYWTIMGGCHGWLRGTHPQPSIRSFFFLYLNTSSAEMWKVFCCVMRDVFGLWDFMQWQLCLAAAVEMMKCVCARWWKILKMCIRGETLDHVQCSYSITHCAFAYFVVVRTVDPLVKHDRSFSICLSNPCEQRGLMKEEMGCLRNTK